MTTGSRSTGVYVASRPPNHPNRSTTASVIRRYFSGIVALAVLLQIAVIVRGADAEQPLVYTGITSRLHSLSSITLSAPEHADHPELALVSVMAPWQALEPADDAFDWSRLDANVRDARDNGYRLIIRVMAGRSAPSWLPNVGVAQMSLLGMDQNAVDFCDRIQTSIPWDPVLQTEYTEMMRELGRWLSRSDGAGRTNGAHVYLVPVSMPSILGTEMVYGYGPSVRCPAGTDGAGTDLPASNRAAWDRISTESQRREWVAAAWRNAIDIHMRELPVNVRSVIAYGSVFGDGHGASMRIAQEKVTQYGGRLWGMYTNLQPEVAADGSLSPWRVACSKCDAVIRQTVASGGGVGFQVAGGPVNDQVERFRYSVNDALASYPTMFIETSPGRIDTHEDFLLTGSDPVQLQLARLANPTVVRETLVRVTCEPAVVGRAGTCSATVSDAGGEGATTPLGTDSVTWTTTAAGTFSPSRCTPAGADGTAMCSVSYTPGKGSAGAHGILAAYAGDGLHAAADAGLDLTVNRRRSATSVACGQSTTAPGSATCSANVEDVDAGDASTPSGEVVFSLQAGDVLGSCALEVASNSKARCTFDYLPSGGTQTVIARYAGDPDHGASAVDQPASVSIEPVPVEPVPPTDSVAPAITITRPVDGATVRSRNLMIGAEASDDVGVVAVAFAVNGETVCEDVSPGWSCSWRRPDGTDAVYTVTATATDAAGNASTSTVVVSGR
jgi:hypothetical protein